MWVRRRARGVGLGVNGGGCSVFGLGVCSSLVSTLSGAAPAGAPSGSGVVAISVFTVTVGWQALVVAGAAVHEDGRFRGMLLGVAAGHAFLAGLSVAGLAGNKDSSLRPELPLDKKDDPT